MKLERMLTLLLLIAPFAVGAQIKSNIPMEKGERWYGAITALGSRMPFADLETQDLANVNHNNQTVPFLVSNKGRYIHSDKPFSFSVENGIIKTDSKCDSVTAVTAGNTLRDAYRMARNRFFAGDTTIPDDMFFSCPQYNTWIELMYNQNQNDIERYADAIVSNGFKAGILMIDDNWQRYYGNFDFKAEKFPNPKGMIQKLHAQGFKIMLWISPFVSADSPEFRELEKKGFLIKKKGSSQAAVIRWWNGCSGCYDLTNKEAFNHLMGMLKDTQLKYGVDGFKFDAGDPCFYNPATQDYHKKDAQAVDHTQAWAELGLHFKFNEYRACWKMQGLPLVQRLGDKDYSWNALGKLIPEMINAGLMGYAYTCPDMIGGGQFSSFLDVTPANIDQELIVRSAQVHAMMPMMQFSVAPWRVLDAEHLEYCRKAASLHTQMSPYILRLAKNAAITGEPIVRSMEYVFPNQGFSACLDQFMLGDEYLVAPILKKQGVRSVKLPKGTWIDDEGKKYVGPQVEEISAETGRLPYYKRK